jgi:hypothetical protein
LNERVEQLAINSGRHAAYGTGEPSSGTQNLEVRRRFDCNVMAHMRAFRWGPALAMESRLFLPNLLIGYEPDGCFVSATASWR